MPDAGAGCEEGVEVIPGDEAGEDGKNAGSAQSQDSISVHFAPGLGLDQGGGGFRGGQSKERSWLRNEIDEFSRVLWEGREGSVFKGEIVGRGGRHIRVCEGGCWTVRVGIHGGVLRTGNV